MNKTLKLATAASAALALVGLAASPALAVGGPTIPASDKLFVIECDSNQEANDNQLYSVAPETGVITAVGDGTGAAVDEQACASQGAQQPGTDWFYFGDWSGSEDTLKRVNLVTGEVETIGLLTDGGTPTSDLYSMAFDPDGTLYYLDYDEVWTVDITTGALTFVVAHNFYDEYGGYPYGFAYDGVTQKFYVVEDGDGSLYEFDPATGAKTYLSYNGDYWVGAIAFDSEGNIWTTGDGDHVSKVSIADFGDSSAWQDSPLMNTATGTLYSESIWVSVPAASAPELPNTGVSVAGLLGLVAALSIAGASILVARRRA